VKRKSKKRDRGKESYNRKEKGNSEKRNRKEKGGMN
jgi:hypothetical protein